MSDSCDPTDCSLPDSFAYRILQARILKEILPFPSPGDLPAQELNPGLLHDRQIRYQRSYAAKSLQSCSTLYDPIDGSPPGSPVPGILQVRTLEWVAISFSSAWKWKVKVKSFSCVQLSDPMDRSLPSSSIHGFFQVRVLEWGSIAFSEI